MKSPRPVNSDVGFLLICHEEDCAHFLFVYFHPDLVGPRVSVLVSSGGLGCRRQNQSGRTLMDARLESCILWSVNRKTHHPPEISCSHSVERKRLHRNHIHLAELSSPNLRKWDRTFYLGLCVYFRRGTDVSGVCADDSRPTRSQQVWTDSTLKRRCP